MSNIQVPFAFFGVSNAIQETITAKSLSELSHTVCCWTSDHSMVEVLFIADDLLVYLLNNIKPIFSKHLVEATNMHEDSKQYECYVDDLYEQTVDDTTREMIDISFFTRAHIVFPANIIVDLSGKQFKVKRHYNTVHPVRDEIEQAALEAVATFLHTQFNILLMRLGHELELK
jgi:hypothetical protein